jgi:hypothetical protein
MTDCRSFYLEYTQNDSAGLTEAALNLTDIPFVQPANDNKLAKARLATRGRALFRRLMINLRVF